MKLSHYFYLAVFAAGSLAPRLAHADGRNFNTSGTLDCLMLEERRPYFQGNQWSPYNDNTKPVESVEGASFYYYTGLGYGVGYTTPFWHWSTWPISNPVQSNDVIQIVYFGQGISGHGGNGGEGTSAGMDMDATFTPNIHTNVWYRFAIRSWLPADGTPHLGYIGEWMRDGSTGNWYHLGSYQTPFEPTGVTGVGGFMENFCAANQAFRIDDRNCFAHQSGTANSLWERANICSVQGNSGSDYIAEPIETNTATMIEYFGPSCASDPLGTNSSGLVFNANGATAPVTMANQLATPPFDPIVVSNSSATVYGSQLIVQWQEPATSSPQLSYKIEVFNNSGYTGSAALTYFTYDTEAQQCLLNVPGVSTPYVRLTIADIFNNTNTPILITPVAATLNPATNVVGTVAGLNYQYYQTNGTMVWTNLPDFAALTPVLQGAVNNLDLTPRLQRAEYGFNYTGFFQAPSNGIYTFTLTSFDSSELIIDGNVVINFNWLHEPGSLSGAIGLQAGKHTVNVQYAFSDQRDYSTDWDGVWLACQGPGLTNTVVSGGPICPGLIFSEQITNLPVPDSCWSRLPGGNEPVITITTPASGATICGSNVTLNVSITTNGATSISQVQYYLGGTFISWGQSGAGPDSLNALFGAAPTNLVRARLFYNNGSTMDSLPQSVFAVTNMNVAPWQLAAVGQQHVYPTGVNLQGGTISLLGDEFNLMCRQVTGNCTIIARLAGITSSASLPDGSTPDSSGEAGIILRNSLGTDTGDPLGGDEIDTDYSAVFGEVNGSVYYEDSTMAGGNGAPNRTSGNLGSGNKWLQIQRVGNTFTTLVSPNGVNWTAVNTTNITTMDATLYVGVFNNTTYADPMSYSPHANFDNVSITGNVVGAPSITVSPASASASVGQSITFTSGTVGQPPFSYQWQLNQTNLVGATNATLTLANLPLTNSGTYTVSLVASNGSATSLGSLLTVTVPWTWNASHSPAGAQDGNGTWGGPVTNWWNGAANVAWQDGNTAAFGVNTTTNCTVTLTNDVTPSGLNFNATGGGSYTLAGTNNIWAVNSPLQIVDSASATISARLNGSAGIIKTGSGTLTFSGNSSYNYNYVGTGPIAINGGTLVLDTTGWGEYYGGTIDINNGSTLRVTEVGGGYRYDFGGTTFAFDANGGGTLDTYSGVNFVFDSGNTFTTGGGAQDAIIGSSGFNLNGTSATFNLTRGTSPTGDLRVAAYIWNSGSVVENGNGILELDATNSYTGTTTIDSGTLWVNGRIAAGAVTVASGATLGGSGVIGGATTINAGGTLCPGSTNLGTLTINNTLTLAGNAVMQLNQSSATNAMVQGLSTVTYGGSLTVTNLAGTLAAGNSFPLFNASSYAGSFAGITLPSLNAGLAWHLSNLTVNGSLAVVAYTGVNPPASAPSNLTVTPASTTQFTVNWSAVANATTYVLSRNGTPIATLTGTNYLDSGLVAGTTYCYTVTAVNTGGSSAASASVCATALTAGLTLAWNASAATVGAQDGSGNWGSGAANWWYSANNFDWLDGCIASFGVNTTTNCTVTITNEVTPLGITFNQTGGGVYTLAGNGGVLNLSGTPVIMASNSATINAVVQGAGAMVLEGGGTLTLGNANSYAGGTTVNAGTLSGIGTAFGTGTINLNSNATTLAVTSGTLANNVNVATGVSATLNLAGGLTFSGQFSGSGILTNTGGSYTQTRTFTGVANSGFTGTLVAQRGTYVFSGANANFSGADFQIIPINTGDTATYLEFTGAGTTAIKSVSAASGGQFEIGPSTIVDLQSGVFNRGTTSSQTVTIMPISGTTSTLTSSGGALTFGGASGTIAINAGVTLADYGVGTPLSVIQNGSETLTMAGTNTYTGNTTVNHGTLALAMPTLATNSTVTVASGAVLQLNFTATNRVAALVLNGVSKAAAVYNSTTGAPYLTGAGSLMVAPIIATNPTNIIASVNSGNLNLFWPANHTGWRLLEQTNHLALGPSSNANDWGTVAGSSTTNQVSIPIKTTNPVEFYRLVYP